MTESKAPPSRPKGPIVLQSLSMAVVNERKKSGEINSNNCHQFAPYWFDDGKATADAAVTSNGPTAAAPRLLIDCEWWLRDLTAESRKWISACAELGVDHWKNVTLVTDQRVAIPHAIQKMADYEVVWDVYQIYGVQFYYDRWGSAMKLSLPPCRWFPLSVQLDLPALKKISNSRRFFDRPILKADLDDLEEHFVPALEKAMKELTTIEHAPPPYFVKLSMTSGKNEQSPRTCYEVKDVVDVLTNNRLLAENYHNTNLLPIAIRNEIAMHVILVQWQPALRSSNEFRVFIYRRRITAITQQLWFKSFGFGPTTCIQSESSAAASTTATAGAAAVAPAESGLVAEAKTKRSANKSSMVWPPHHMENVARSIVAECEQTIIPALPCDSAVLDVWVEMVQAASTSALPSPSPSPPIVTPAAVATSSLSSTDTKSSPSSNVSTSTAVDAGVEVQYRTHLIELNPWLVSGAGTFDWPKDFNMIHGCDSTFAPGAVVVRYVE